MPSLLPLSRKTAFSILGVFTVLFIASLPQRVVHIDDAWLGEYSYWFAKLGYVKSELMRGITHQEDYIIMSHKLLIVIGSLFIKAFGFSVYNLKAVSLCFLVLFIPLFYIITVKKLQFINLNQFLLLLSLFIGNALIQEYAFVFRPEIPLMFFGFLAYYFIEKSIKKESHFYALIAGITTGLAVLIHLNGLIYAGAGFFTLIILKKQKQLPLYIIGGVLTSALYFLDFNETYGIDFWKYQIFESPFLDHDGSPIYIQLLLNLANEQMRFFHSPREISLTLILLFVFFLTFKNLKNRYPVLTVFTFLTMFFLAIIAAHRTSKYAIVYFPHLMLLITLGINSLLDPEQKSQIVYSTRKKILEVLLSIYFVTQIVFIVFILKEKENLAAKNNIIVEQFIDSNEKKNLNIAANMPYIFNEIEEFNRIQAMMTYEGLLNQDSTMVGEKFIEKASSFNLDYLFLNQWYQNLLQMNGYQKGQNISNYIILEKTEELMVLKRNN